MKRGEIATISQAHRFLSDRGIEYSHPDGVGQLLRRRKVSSRRAGRATKRPTPNSRRLSKKVRR
jgi:hypothetical protein